MDNDILVVGCGPAGLMTTERTAAYGLKVSVFEKNGSVTDSLMGELVTDKALRLLRVRPDSDCVSNKFTEIVGESLDTHARIVVDRRLLGNSYLLDEDACQELMRDRAQSNGAVFHYNTRVTSVLKENGMVVGVRYGTETASAPLTVGADGSHSVISATAGFTHPRWLLSYGYRYKLVNCRGIDPNVAYFYVGRDVGLGYLWFYPRSSTEANLGIGRVPSTRQDWARLPPMIDVLKKYIKTHDETRDARIINLNGGVVPCAGLIPRFTDAGVALCGNAAGQVSSIVGGGVTTCFHAATVLAKHAKRMADAGDYSRASVRLYEEEYRKSRLAHNIQNTGNGMWAVSRYAMFNDPLEAAEMVLSQLDAKTLNEVIQGHATPTTLLTLFTDFLPMLFKIGKGYLKSAVLSSVATVHR